MEFCHEATEGQQFLTGLGKSNILALHGAQSYLTLQFGCPMNGTPTVCNDTSSSGECTLAKLRIFSVPHARKISIHIHI